MFKKDNFVPTPTTMEELRSQTAVFKNNSELQEKHRRQRERLKAMLMKTPYFRKRLQNEGDAYLTAFQDSHATLFLDN